MENAADQFVCGQCQEKLDTLTSFLLHKVQHVDMGKPGGCPLCGMAFSRQVSLQEHLHRKHNIPELKVKVGCGKKRRSHVRNELSNQESTEVVKIPTSESEVKMTPVCETSNFVDPETMHVIVDQIKGGDLRLSSGDLTSTVLHTDCSVVYQPHNSTTVLLGEEEVGGDFGPLMAQVDEVAASSHAFPPHSLQTETDNLQSNHSLQHTVTLVETSSQSLERHVHLLHSESEHEHMAEHKAGIDGAEAIVVTVPATRNVASISQAQQPPPSSNATAQQEEKEEAGEQDFLFILVTNHVKRKSLSYSKLSFRCFHCQYRTFWRRALVKHMREGHSDHLAIHQCIAVSNSEKVHGQQVMKMSEYLGVLAKQRKQMNGHRIRGVEKQDLPGYHPCSKCDKVFGRLRYLRKHQAIHKAEKRFLCDDCGKAFKTKAYLAAHRLTHQTKVYRCGQCDFASSINALIHAHRQLHSDGSVICEVCGSAYNDRATLKKHKQVHDKSRPFPCDYPGCTWRFKTEVMCRAHYRAHTTSGRFACHVCTYVFRHKHHLQRHLAKVHGMDDATVFHTTKKPTASPAPKVVAIQNCEEKEYVKVLKDEDGQLVSDTVSLIVDTGLSTEQLQSVLESGQFVIATDDSDSAVNYEIANIAMNVSYDALTDATEGGAVSEGQTVFIPTNEAECSQIIFQQEQDTTVHSSNMET